MTLSTLAAARGLRLERVRACPRFKDGVFRNTQLVAPRLKPGTTLPTMGEFFFGGQRRAPPGPLPAESPLARWARPAETGLRATWLGHSTVLLELEGRRVLTDPVWGERASPVRFAGPRRFQPAPVPIAALPELDAVVISHDHYDHLDRPSILELARREVPFDLVMLEVGAYHPAWGDIHLGPANALEALRLLGGGRLLPVHWGTFSLAVHAWDEPAETLVELGARQGAQLVMPRLGAPVEPARVEGVEPWWRGLGGRRGRPPRARSAPGRAP